MTNNNIKVILTTLVNKKIKDEVIEEDGSTFIINPYVTMLLDLQVNPDEIPLRAQYKQIQEGNGQLYFLQEITKMIDIGSNDITGSDTIIAGLESAFLGPKSAQYYCNNCVGTSISLLRMVYTILVAPDANVGPKVIESMQDNTATNEDYEKLYKDKKNYKFVLMFWVDQVKKASFFAKF